MILVLVLVLVCTSIKAGPGHSRSIIIRLSFYIFSS